MLGDRAHVELLTTIGAVAMLDEVELLEDVERAIHRGRDGCRVACAAELDQLRAGDVAVRLDQHLDHRAALGRPPQAPLAQSVANGVPRGRQSRVHHQ